MAGTAEAEDHIEQAIATWMDFHRVGRAEAAAVIYDQAVASGEETLIEIAGGKLTAAAPHPAEASRKEPV